MIDKEVPSDQALAGPGGWGGIRTPGGREPTPVFKTGALNHSATHPTSNINHLAFQRSTQNPKWAHDWHPPAPITGVIVCRTFLYQQFA